MKKGRLLIFCLSFLLWGGISLSQEVKGWRWHPQDDPAFAFPSSSDEGWKEVEVGYKWRMGERTRCWLRSWVKIPEMIDGESPQGKPVAIYISAGEGGEIYLDGKLQSRYDNDHPGACLLSKSARVGEEHCLAIRVFGPTSGEKEMGFDQAEWKILPEKKAREPLLIWVRCSRKVGILPSPLAGISQGGGMADYKDETANLLAQLRPRWFRMDNMLTSVVRMEGGRLIYDWSDFDKRIDFIFKTGAEPIVCLSYMPIPFDAVPDPDRHSAPKDYSLWEDLCYKAATRCIERGKRVRYWEVWNEANAGWLKPRPGETPLKSYLKLYTASARGIKRADPNAWIGGPCNASGPWNTSPEHPYCVNGETFMKGLIEYCDKTGVPLDFITWHEYFHPPQVFREEMEQTLKYLDEHPKVKRKIKGFFLTEFNYAWWHDWAQDNEIGASWVANNVIRSAIPAGITGICFFFAKDGNVDFQGNWGLLRGDNKPKPVYHVYKLFREMSPQRLELRGEDEEITGIASLDEREKRLTILLVHFAERYGIRREVKLVVEDLPPWLKGGRWRRYLVDATHSNIFHDEEKGSTLQCVEEGNIGTVKSKVFQFTLLPNSVTFLELHP